MQVSSLMNAEVAFVSPLALLEKAARLMGERQIGFLPVLGDGRIRGVLTDRDIVIRGVATGKDGLFSKVGDIMTHGAICCLATDDDEYALELMRSRGIRRLPVFDHLDRIVGVIHSAAIAANLLPSGQSIGLPRRRLTA